ncbi:MAG: type II toxin-antitoxin system VapC family toxin [Leptolyngbya sp. SIOISBB]|nr:type II toxin-antitoxin system VapC family toxin [Leptolyngbya sp. SIOISBB]
MNAVDTDILARFYVDDPNDPEAQLQRPLARQVLAESSGVLVPLTVILELEWVLRAFYGFGSHDFVGVIHHLLGLSHVTVEHWERVADAVEWHLQGVDWADALHLAASHHCENLMSFDDKRFARRAQRLKLQPSVVVPESSAGT